MWECVEFIFILNIFLTYGSIDFIIMPQTYITVSPYDWPWTKTISQESANKKLTILQSIIIP